jgi:hypothetical protein
MKTTCWDCDKKQKNFCRRHNVSKNSTTCEFVQKNDWKAAKLSAMKR